MKKFASILLAIACCVGSASAQSFSLKSLLSGLADSTSTKTSTTTTTSTSSSSSSLLGSTLTSIISNVLSTTKVTPADLVGTWSYSAPAVTFKSSNLLLKAGGTAAATTVENKLSPYYQKAGINKMVLTVNSDSTFTMKFAKGSLSGTVTTGSESGTLVFQYKALKAIPIGSYTAYVSKSGNTVTLTYDVSKLMTLMNAISSVAGSTSISAVNSLLQSYDGIQAGFKLTKSSN